MGKPPGRHSKEIEQSDLNDFIEHRSDFAFELKCLKVMSDLGYKCEHGGSYIDPVEKKPRQFDIRAVVRGQDTAAYLAIECKNLSNEYPALAMCVPRRSEEAWHMVLHNKGDSNLTGYDRRVARCSPTPIDELKYRAGEPVAKSCVQIGRQLDKDGTPGAFDEKRGGIFDRWSQALASATDLVEQALTELPNSKGKHSCSAIIPIVVVPDGTLWAAIWGESGDLRQGPREAERVSLYVNHAYKISDTLAEKVFRISHIEMMTQATLAKMAKDLRCSIVNRHDFGISPWAPSEHLANDGQIQ